MTYVARSSLLFTLVLAGPAFAEPIPANKAEIESAFVGKTAVFADGATATYNASGTYTYRASFETYGKYTIAEGEICVRFTNGFSRCDKIFKDGDKFTLRNAAGATFPISQFK